MAAPETGESATTVVVTAIVVTRTVVRSEDGAL